MKRQWNIVLLIVLILLVVLFSVLNVDPVAINFGFSVIQVPLVIVIIATLLIGVLIAVILSTAMILQNKNEQKKLNQLLTEAEEKARREKEDLNALHNDQMSSLKEENDRAEAKIRELERHIQNLETSNAAQDKQQS